MKKKTSIYLKKLFSILFFYSICINLSVGQEYTGSQNFIVESTTVVEGLSQEQLDIYNSLMTTYFGDDYDKGVQNMRLIHINVINDENYDGHLIVRAGTPFISENINFDVGFMEYTDEDEYKWFGNYKNEDFEADSLDEDPSPYSEGTLTIASIDGAKTGSLILEDQTYIIADLGDGEQVMIKIPLLDPETQYCMSTADEGDQDEYEESTSCLEHKLKIYILYTAAANNTGLSPLGTATAAIAQLQGIWNNSHVWNNSSVEILAAQYYPFTETGNFTNDKADIFSDLGAVNSTYLNGDLTIVFTNGTYGGIQGEAFNVIAGQSNRFAIVQITSATSSIYTFAHELSHLFGCRHDKAHDNAIYESAHGHAIQGTYNFWHFASHWYRTVMKYQTHFGYYGEPVIPYFSNPNVGYNNHGATGASDENNAQRIIDNMLMVEDYELDVNNALKAGVYGTNNDPCSNYMTAASNAECGNPPYTYQWYKSTNGMSSTFTIISGATSSTVSIPWTASPQPSSIWFKVVVTDNSSNSVTTIKHVFKGDCCTNPNCGLRLASPKKQQLTVSDDFSIFPNPAINQIHVEFPSNDDGILNYEIINSLGMKVVTGEKIVNNRDHEDLIVNTANLSDGLYHFSGTINNNNIISNFVVNH